MTELIPLSDEMIECPWLLTARNARIRRDIELAIRPVLEREARKMFHAFRGAMNQQTAARLITLRLKDD